MKPIDFEESNKNLLKPIGMTEEECGNLPVFSDGKTCISCWRVPFWKRIWLIFHGHIWLGVLSGETQPPVWLSCEDTVFKKMIEYDDPNIEM